MACENYKKFKMSVSISKVFIETSHVLNAHFCLLLHNKVELSNWDTDLQSLRYLFSVPLQKVSWLLI